MLVYPSSLLFVCLKMAIVGDKCWQWCDGSDELAKSALLVAKTKLMSTKFESKLTPKCEGWEITEFNSEIDY